MKNNIKSYIMPTYGRQKIEFISGKGCYLKSIDKKNYLDFGSGIAVNSLGHCYPSVVKALREQSSKLWHTSNLYYNKNQEDYAKKLCENSFADQVFFTNSGAEAIECGIKVIRSYHDYHKHKNKKKIITFDGAFHGRTFAALSAQMNKKYSENFKPMMPGFTQCKFNDIDSVKKKIDKYTAAILIEPIQGEGGIRPANLKFLKQLRELCNKYKILLFLDEVQCGFGRSGKFFSYEWAGIKPDILALAKGIGSGFPLGACLSTSKSSIGMVQGSHGSTYGGNPLAISVGRSVIDVILKLNFLKKVDIISRYLWDQLLELKKDNNEILEVRGAGLLLGLKTKQNNLEFYKKLLNNGLLTVPASDNIVRLSPPLIIKKKHVDEAIKIIKKTIKE